MKIVQFIIIFIIVLIPINFIGAQEVNVDTKGRVLLQKDVRVAWYVNPSDMTRHRLSSAADVLKVMQKLGLGISNKDFNFFNDKAPKRLAGKILIKVEDNGKAYYVNPIDLKINFLGEPQKALFVLRELGIGISDDELEKIQIFGYKDDGAYKIHSSALQQIVNPEYSKQATSTQGAKDYVNGIYLTASTFRNIDIDAFIKRNENSPLNSVVVDLAGFGLLSKYVKDNPEIIKKIDKLKEAGFYFIARLVVLNNSQAAKISPLKSKTGAIWDGVWADGSTSEVKKYYRDIVMELAKLNIDEIQLDYIRFPTSLFSRQTPSTRVERTKIITDLVAAVYAKTQEHGIKLSIDVFGILAWNEATNIKRLGQDVSQLIDYVDYISPMIYPSHFNAGFGGFARYDDPYTTIKASTKKFIELLGEENKEKIRPWIQGFSYRAPNFGADYIYAQVKALADLGVPDFLVWNASNMYAPTHQMFTILKAQ